VAGCERRRVAVAAGGQRGSTTSATMDDLGMLGGINIINIFNQYYGQDPEANPYLNCTVSGHHDLLEIYSNNLYKEKPIILSVNIQSLNSKFNELKQMLSEFEQNNINIVAVALQEIWQIHHPDLMQILLRPGNHCKYCT
jgi:hypothetical protein